MSGSDQSPIGSPAGSPLSPPLASGARPAGPLELEEYRQLRATIRERGSLRVVLFVVTLVAWAVVAGLVAAVLSLPLASLLSLILLIAGFEAVHSLHISVERIGRYLYARYESGARASGGAGPSDGAPGMADSPIHPRPMWEGTIARFGIGYRPSTRPADALFSLIFLSAIIVNFMAATLDATTAELIGIGAIHALAAVRVIAAKRAAGGQRAEDQKRFDEVLR